MFNLVKQLKALLVVALISGCVPPLPFLEHYCLPPIKNSDFDSNGSLTVFSRFNHSFDVSGYQHGKKDIVYNGETVTLSVLNRSLSPKRYSTNDLKMVENSKIKVVSVNGEFFRGPNYFISPPGDNYQAAISSGDYVLSSKSDHQSTGYLGKGYRVRTNGGTVEVKDNNGRCVNIKNGDKLVFTISPVNINYNYRDDNGNTQNFRSKIRSTKSWQYMLLVAIVNYDFDWKTDKEKEDWYLQYAARKIMYKIGGRDNIIVGDSDDSDINKNQVMVKYSSMREKIAKSDGCLKLFVDGAESDIDVKVFVKIYHDRVPLIQCDENGRCDDNQRLPINMHILECSSAGEGCDPNIYGIASATTFDNIKLNEEKDVGPRSTYVWFSVAEPNISNAYGNISIDYEAQVKQGAGVIYMPVFNIIKERSGAALNSLFNSLVGNVYLRSIAFALLTLWVAMFSLKFVMGLEKITSFEFTLNIIKFGIAIMFVSPNSSEWIKNVIFNGVLGITSEIAYKLTYVGTSGEHGFGGYDLFTPTQDLNPMVFMDGILSVLINSEVLKRLFALFVSPGGILIFAAVIYMVIVMLRAFVKLFFFFAFNFLALRFLLTLSPMIMPLIVWKNQSLKSIVKGYIELILRFCIEPLILIVGMTCIASIFMLVLKAFVLNLWLCFKCVMPINLTGTFIDKIPFLSEITHALCFWGFMPWGIDNLSPEYWPDGLLSNGSGIGLDSSGGYSYGLSSSNSAAMEMLIRYIVPALILLLLAILFENFIEYSSKLAQAVGLKFMSQGMGITGSRGGGGGAAGDAYNAFMGGVSFVAGNVKDAAAYTGGAVVDRVKLALKEDQERMKIESEGYNNKKLKAELDQRTNDLDKKLEEKLDQLNSKATADVPGKKIPHLLKDELINVLGNTAEERDKISGILEANNKDKIDINELRDLASTHLTRTELANSKNLLLLRDQLNEINDAVNNGAGHSAKKQLDMRDRVEIAHEGALEIVEAYKSNSEHITSVADKLIEVEKAENERLKFKVAQIQASIEAEPDKVEYKEKLSSIQQQVEVSEQNIRTFESVKADMSHMTNNIEDFRSHFDTSMNDITAKAATLTRAEAEDTLKEMNKEFTKMMQEQKALDQEFASKMEEYAEKIAEEEKQFEKDGDSFSKIEKDLWTHFTSNEITDFEAEFDTKIADLRNYYGLSEDQANTIKEGLREQAEFAWKKHKFDSGDASVVFTAKEQSWLNKMGS